MRPWPTNPAHHRWLDQHTRDLLAFGRRTADPEGGARWLVYLAAAVVVLGIALLWPASKKERVYSIEEQLAARPPGSFPVPPMDLQVPPSPRARRAVAERQPATVGGTTPSPDDTSDKEV
jgi:NADH-quinone oxidoreductase subunit H